MDDDNELHPLDIISSYGTAGAFIEARLSRLKANSGNEAEVEQCEAMSHVLMNGIMLATSCLDESVHILPDDDAPGAVQMLS